MKNKVLNLAKNVKQAKGTCIFSLGQAGYIIKNREGHLLAIDPYLSNCVERLEGHIGFKRLLPQILNPRELKFDIVITTHEHLDHFDEDSIPELLDNEKTYLFTTINCRKIVSKMKINNKSERIIYVKPKDTYDIAGFHISFVNCDHGEEISDAVGVVIETDGICIYETGDTCLRLDSIEELKVFEKLDILIAPINGAYGNMNELECAMFSHALNPKLTIPCHYGMFASHGGNPGEFYNIMREKYPENEILFMAQGEMLYLQDNK